LDVVGQVGLGLGGLWLGFYLGLWPHHLGVKIVAALLYRLERRDPVALVRAAVTLAMVGALAAWLAAWRASQIDPAELFARELRVSHRPPPPPRLRHRGCDPFVILGYVIPRDSDIPEGLPQARHCQVDGATDARRAASSAMEASHTLDGVPGDERAACGGAVDGERGSDAVRPAKRLRTIPWMDKRSTWATDYQLSESERASTLDEVEELLRLALCNLHGQWTADYFRLRFSAAKS
jgi:hypothetical protein